MIGPFKSTFTVRDCIFKNNTCPNLIKIDNGKEDIVSNLTVDGCNYIDNTIASSTIGSDPQARNQINPGTANKKLSFTLEQNTFVANYKEVKHKKILEPNLYIRFRIKHFYIKNTMFISCKNIMFVKQKQLRDFYSCFPSDSIDMIDFPTFWSFAGLRRVQTTMMMIRMTTAKIDDAIEPKTIASRSDSSLT